MCDVFRKINPCTCHNSKLELQVRCSSAFLRTKLGATPIEKRSSTDFAPSLHRLWYGGRAKEERKKSGRKTLPKTEWLVNEC